MRGVERKFVGRRGKEPSKRLRQLHEEFSSCIMEERNTKVLTSQTVSQYFLMVSMQFMERFI